MAITTYSELQTAIQNYLDRDDLDEEELIDLCEARHKRDVRIKEMITREAITIDSRQESLPTGYLELIQLRLLTDPVTVLQEVNIYEMSRVRVATTGKPTKFSVYNEFEFDRAPDSSYSGEILYYKEMTALSDSNTSNDLLTRAPDLYLYGSLIAAEPFIFNDERLPVWEKLYTSARDHLQAVDRVRGGPLVSRVIGVGP